jgi:hypothetical protein
MPMAALKLFCHWELVIGFRGKIVDMHRLPFYYRPTDY